MIRYFQNGDLAISFLAAQSLLMTLMCPPHSFGYFGINSSKTKTSIEDNHAASAFLNHGKKLNVEAVVQLFGLLSVPVKAGRFGPTTHANSLVQLSLRRETLQNGF